MKSLYEKFCQSVPRYATYPTVFDWQKSFETENWHQVLARSFESSKNLAIYIHVPFCEKLCQFCGCNTVITQDHGVESEYIGLIEKEWRNYLQAGVIPDDAKVVSINLGGGTPNFLSSSSMEKLLQVFGDFIDAGNFSGFCEVDPRHFDPSQAEVLTKNQFRDFQVGVQDFDSHIQARMGRNQKIEEVQSSFETLKRDPKSRIGIDLIWGFPGQSVGGWKKNLETVKYLDPNRVTLYRWVPPKSSSESSPDWDSYEFLRNSLFALEFIDIGLDHFCKSTDPWAIAREDGKLKRSFSGFHSNDTEVLLGLGVGAISDTPFGFHQNEKAYPVYKRKLLAGESTSFRGLELDSDQMEKRKLISDVLLTGKIGLKTERLSGFQEYLKEKIIPAMDENWIEVGEEIVVSPKGRCLDRFLAKTLDDFLSGEKS